MLFEQIMFFLAAAGALGGALGVVILRNPFFSVLSLIAHLISLAVLFLLLHAEFVAAAQVVVYAGAIMVLYLFVTAYIGGADQSVSRADETGVVGQIGVLMAASVFVVLSIAILGSGLEALDTRGAELEPGFGTPGEIGRLLLERFLVPFEVAAFLLLVATVCAVMLARRRRGLDDEEESADLPGTGSGPFPVDREARDEPRPESEGGPDSTPPTRGSGATAPEGAA